MSFSVTPPIRDLPPHTVAAGPNRVVPIGRLPITVPFAPEAVANPVALTSELAAPVLQLGPPTPLVPFPNLTFEGLSASDDTAVFGSTVAPPDTNGDVGPDHYVQMVNTVFRVFDKLTGFPLTPPTALSSLFASLPGACADTDDGDPVVLYDPLADRWLLTQFANAFNGPPFFMSIAVSQSGDPAGAYFVYCFQMPNDKFNDYPKFGVWPDGYYMTDNQFAVGFVGAGVFAFDRAKMLVGDPTATYVYFDLENVDASIAGMLPSDLDGPPPPVGTPNYFMYFVATERGDAVDGLRIFEFVPNYTTPASSTFTERADSPVIVAPFDPVVPEIPQPPGDGTTLDSVSDRLMFRLQYRNFTSYETLVVCHTVNANGAGQAGVRYYELRRPLPAGDFSVNEQATLAPDTDNRWMGSAAMDASGNLAVGYSVSSATIHPSIRYAARLANDPPGGLFQGEAELFAGSGSQTDGLNRWGDYSALTVDPFDDCTFWYTTEYLAQDGSFNWRTRIGSFIVGDCESAAVPRLNLAFDEAIVSGGNDNGFIDVGECLNLNVVIGNLSTNEVTDVGATLTTSTPGVTITQGVSAYADFPASGTSTNVTPFQFCVSTNVACGSQISFFLTLTNAVGSAIVNFSFDVGISTNLMTVNFEKGLQGITIQNDVNGLWHLSKGRSTQPGHSKTNSMYYGKGETVSGGGNYNTGSSNAIGFASSANRGTFTLQPLNLTGVNGMVLMTFNQFLDRETSSPNYDVAKVEASTDGGQSFVTVGGPFTSTSKVSSFHKAKFRKGTVALTPFLNTEVILRFSFDSVDNQSNTFEGWYVDDIVIKSFACALDNKGAGQIVSQGTTVTNVTGVFATFRGIDGTNLLTQSVLTNGPHSDFRSLPVDTAGNGIQSIAVTATSRKGRIDFEVRDGFTGTLVSSNSLLAFLTAPYQATSADVTGATGQELLLVASGPDGTFLNVVDSTSGETTSSTAVLGSGGSFTSYAIVPADVNGSGQDEIAVIGVRPDSGQLVAELRNGTTGALISSPKLQSLTQPFSALAAELNGTPAQELAVLARRQGRNVLALVDGLTGKARTKTVLKNVTGNAHAVAAEVLPSTGKEIVLLGTTDAGGLLLEVVNGKGKRIRSFQLNTQVTGPITVIAADINGDGLQEIIVSGRRVSDDKPILLALDANTGGSLYLASLFESVAVKNVNVFASDVDGDGILDVVANAVRTLNARALFEVRAGVSGSLFSAFDQGGNFAGPNAAFGARVGD